VPGNRPAAVGCEPDAGLGNGARDQDARCERPRREKRLFPIEQDIHYQCLKVSRRSTIGVGKTTKMGSQEVCFTTQHALQPGERVRLVVAWPAMLGDTCMMNLEILGSVVRSEPGTAAIKIARHEFRTRGASFTVWL